ncbi:MAG: sigma-70 family RNA polymerase sigma factor [Candidatus Levyibacteriota bacterium]
MVSSILERGVHPLKQGAIFGKSQSAVEPMIESSPKQVFQSLWSVLKEARMARATLINRTKLQPWSMTPQGLKEEVEEILEGSKYIRGYVILPSRLPALQISTVKKRIEDGKGAHQAICQRLLLHIQPQLEENYGGHARSLRQIVNESVLQVVTTFQGGSESKIQEALDRQLMIAGEEQIYEIRKIMLGDKVQKYDGLVWSCVRRLAEELRAAGIPDEDAFQEGRIGLIKAFEAFDPSRSKFLTFARSKVGWRLRDMIRDANPGKRSIYETKKKINDFESMFEVANGRQPTIEELALGTGLSAERIEEIKQLPRIILMSRLRPTKLRAIDNGTDVAIVDPNQLERPEEHLLAMEENRSQQERVHELYAAMKSLTPRLAVIIRRHFLEGATFKQVSKELRISESRVLQLKNEAIAKLREIMENKSKSP